MVDMGLLLDSIRSWGSSFKYSTSFLRPYFGEVLGRVGIQRSRLKMYRSVEHAGIHNGGVRQSSLSLSR